MIGHFTLRTTARSQLIEISAPIREFINSSKFRSGLCLVFTPHTTAGITINENANPSVKSDILGKLNASFPQEDGYRHAEGNSDAHIKSSLIGCSETIIVENGELILGTWQGIFFCEFNGPRQRQYIVRLVSG